MITKILNWFGDHEGFTFVLVVCGVLCSFVSGILYLNYHPPRSWCEFDCHQNAAKSLHPYEALEVCLQGCPK